MKLKGIIKGQSIELLEPIAIAEGSEVTAEISKSELENKPDWTELKKLLEFGKKILKFKKSLLK